MSLEDLHRLNDEIRRLKELEVHVERLAETVEALIGELAALKWIRHTHRLGDARATLAAYRRWRDGMPESLQEPAGEPWSQSQYEDPADEAGRLPLVTCREVSREDAEA